MDTLWLVIRVRTYQLESASELFFLVYNSAGEVVSFGVESCAREVVDASGFETVGEASEPVERVVMLDSVYAPVVSDGILYFCIGFVVFQGCSLHFRFYF